MFKRYLGFMQRHPYAGSLLTAGLVGTSGDVTSQLLFPTTASGVATASATAIANENETPISTYTVQRVFPQLFEGTRAGNISLNRVLEVVSFQLMTVIPIHYWFKNLDIVWAKRFPLNRYTKLVHIGTKVLFHQTVFATTINTLFFGWVIGCDLGVSQLKELPRLWSAKVVADLPTTVVASSCFWIPWNATNFTFVPLAGRVAWASCGMAIWVVFLSAIGHNDTVSAIQSPDVESGTDLDCAVVKPPMITSDEVIGYQTEGLVETDGQKAQSQTPGPSARHDTAEAQTWWQWITGQRPSNLPSTPTLSSPFEWSELNDEIQNRVQTERLVSEFMKAAQVEWRKLETQERSCTSVEQRESIQKKKMEFREYVIVEVDKLLYGNTEPHARQNYINKYGCAQWTDRSMSILLGLCPVVEMGAGAGHWVKELRARGGKVNGFDTFQDPTPGQSFNKSDYVTQANENILQELSRETLLLVYPPPPPNANSKCMATRCLDVYQGNTLVYVGEGRGGSTASGPFFDLLESEWKVVHIEELQPFHHCHERMYVLHRL